MNTVNRNKFKNHAHKAVGECWVKANNGIWCGNTSCFDFSGMLQGKLNRCRIAIINQGNIVQNITQK